MREFWVLVGIAAWERSEYRPE